MVSLNLSLTPSFLKLFKLIHIFVFRGLHAKGSLTYPCYHCQGQWSPEGGLQLHKLTQGLSTCEHVHLKEAELLSETWTAAGSLNTYLTKHRCYGV